MSTNATPTVAAGHDRVIILDFGSQYTQLIARRVRELHVYSEVHPFDLPLERLRALKPSAVILSGGPSSCYDPGAPQISPELFELGVPVLGICYGVQLLSKLLGGKVEPSAHREYGRAELRLRGESELFAGLLSGAGAGWVSDSAGGIEVWMSHGDRIEQVAPGFVIIGESDHSPVAAIADVARRIYGVQFHPEVVHTPRGRDILGNFLFRIAGCRPTWTMASFIDEAVRSIREKVGPTATAICGLSGGVDSSVAAALVHRALGDRLRCIFVDTGLQRLGEAAEVERLFRGHFHMDLTVVDATDRFFRELAGVVEPETKRKRIGREFIAVFDEEAARADKRKGDHPEASFLVQGTLYPDVIESVSHRGPSASIKTHHNVGGLPDRMKLGLIEPLRELFKDEVRELGRELGLPETLVGRHPFPGPGMAVRVLGEVTRERVATVQAADAIVEAEIRKAGLYDSLWQSFAVLLPVRSVGVMGDQRTYAEVIAIRAVGSQDGMTADWIPLPSDVLGRIATRIVNEVAGVNRVVYDVTSKPPGTIEWE